jgi:TonB-linked SusC/RagA family outer membrane protein
VKLPVDGLTYRINTGYTFNNRLYQEYRGANTKEGVERKGWATTYGRYNEEWVIENLLNYKKDFGDHSLFLTGLYSAQKTQSKLQQVSGQNFTSDIRTYYQYGATDVINLADDFTESTILSQMLRANYGFKSKYLLTLTARRDGYSGFGAETKFGIFPSIAVAWNATKEEFVQDLGMDWLDAFKLRLSYGENGNMAISPYRTLPELSSLNYLDGNLNSAFGHFPQALGDPTLGWETSETMNLGADFSLFKGRIQGSADFFKTRTTDLLLNKTISPVNGTTSITQNIGETKNKGFEFQVSSVNLENNNFSWSTDATFSLYRSQIVNVGLTDSLGNYTDDLGSRWFIGQPVNVLFGYKYGGVWQLDDDIANSHQPDALPGDVKVVDINGDGEITTDDRGILGNSQPKFTIGINNTLKYKNVSLSFFIYSVQGVTKSSPLWGTFVNNYQANIYNYDFWSETNPTNEFPANRENNNKYGASRLEDASFTRLKDVTLNYSFNKNLISKFKLNQLDIFFNAKNLFTITNYKYGMDPEFDGVSVTNGNSAIPLSKTYLIGLKLGF